MSSRSCQAEEQGPCLRQRETERSETDREAEREGDRKREAEIAWKRTEIGTQRQTNRALH